MANVDRSRCEVLRRRTYPTTGTDVINVGDMVVKDGSGNARPASVNTGASAAAAKDAVADAFIGVAIHAKPAASTPDIVVGVDLIAEMDITPTGVALNVGDKLEIATTDNGSLWTPTPQIVMVGSTNPIGRVYEKAGASVSTVKVHFVGLDVSIPVVAD